MDPRAYEAVFQLSPTPAAFLTEEGELLTANAAMEALLEEEAASLSGRPLRELLAPSASGRAEHLLRSATAWSEGTVEAPLVRSDGWEVPVELRLSLFVTQKGARLIQLIATDLRERQRRERIHTIALEASRAANGAGSTDALAEGLLRAVGVVIPELDRLVFYLHDPATEALLAIATRGVAEASGWRELHVTLPLAPTPSAPLVVHACQTQESILILDARLEGVTDITGLPETARSLIVVPILAGERLLGALVGGSAAARRLSLDDMHCMEVAASEAASALLRLEVSGRLAATERRYQTILRNMTEGMLVVSAQGDIEEANPAALSMLPSDGDPPGSLVDTLGPREEVESFLRQVATDGEATRYFQPNMGSRERHLRAHGTRAALLPDHIALLLEDAAAEVCERRLQRLAACIPIVLADAPPGPLPGDDLVQAAYDAMEAEAVTLLRADARGLHVVAETGPIAGSLRPDEGALTAWLRAAVLHGEPSVIDLTGTPHLPLGSAALIPAPDGVTTLLLVIGYGAEEGAPVTAPEDPWLKVAADEFARGVQRRTAAEHLRASLERERRAFERVRRLNEEIEEFTLWTTHDLREPLRSLATLATYLEEDLPTMPPEEARSVARRIRSTGETLKERVFALHSFSRLVMGEQSPPALVDLGASLDRARDELRTLLADRRAHIEIETPLPHVEGRRDQLGLVVLNLLENAVKYGDPERPTVWIGTRPDLEAVIFYVEDNGPGIPDEVRDNIFRLFYRAPHHRDVPGSGIGLAIVQRLLSQHGGSVHLEEGRVGGARFVVTLPRTAGAGSPIDEGAATP